MAGYVGQRRHENAVRRSRAEGEVVPVLCNRRVFLFLSVITAVLAALRAGLGTFPQRLSGVASLAVRMAYQPSARNVGRRRQENAI